jgi:anaerobic magnesium-protoporphyrin IX monomethyl ester cyclase
LNAITFEGRQVRVVLLRPPRYLWPFNSETSAFWQPLGLICLAAAVRRNLPAVRVEVWDMPGEKHGWKTLASRLAGGPMDVLGLGEEAVSAHEALRAAELAKRLHPGCKVVVGGVYFSHAVAETLAEPAVDAVIRGEGERTLVEWLRHVDQAETWGEIAGLAFRDTAGKVVTTQARPLIEDLDSLPFAAYDLLPMQAYGKGSRNHPGLTSIEHSRGCVDSCGFCILWRHMGQVEKDERRKTKEERGELVPSDDEASARTPMPQGIVRPCYRTKSAGRSFEEVERLYREFDRRTFGWVDPTFNVSADWSDKWAEMMLRSRMMGADGRPRTLHTAWMRADYIVRDHKAGILEKLVRAGLRQAMIGVERDDPAGMALLGKHHNGPELCAEAFAILREHYPEVYTIGSMIFGLPGDTLADVRRLSRCQFRWGMDYCFLIPLTPNPGTEFAVQPQAAGQVRRGALAGYDFHTAVLPTQTLAQGELESIYWRMLLDPSWPRLRQWCRRILFERDTRKRRLDRALMKHGVKVVARRFLRTFRRHKNNVSTATSSYARRPVWYDT